jgi:hypothetical protein
MSEIENKTVCRECCEITETNMETYFEKYNEHLCMECFETHYTECPDCNEIVHNNYCTRVGGDVYMCDACIENEYDNYAECSKCSNKTLKSDGEFHDESDDIFNHEIFICNACIENEDNEEVCSECHLIECCCEADRLQVIADDELAGAS